MKTRKTVSLLTTCLLLMSLLTAMPASAATNLFTHENVGGETGDTKGWGTPPANGGWTVSAYEATEESTVLPYAGDYCIKVEKTVANTEAAETVQFSGAPTVEYGTEYVFSAKVNVPDEMEGEVAQLYARVTNGATSSDKYKLSAGVKQTNGWETVGVSFTPVDEALIFYIRYPANTTGTIYLDDLRVCTKAEWDAEVEAEAALKFSFLKDYTPSLAMESGENWLYESDSTSASFDQTVKMQGNSSLKTEFKNAVAGAENNTKYNSTRPTVEEGKTYVASVWYRIPENETNVKKVALSIGYPKAVSGTSYIAAESSVTNTNGQWRRLSLAFTSGRTAALGLVRLKVVAEANGSATVNWDAFTLVEKTAQDPVLQMLDENDLDMLAPEKGAFTVKYDIHKTADDAEMTGKSLIAAIYKTVDGKKQLAQINIGTFAAEDTAVSLPMTGIAASENAAAYSMKVMLWDSIAGMQNLKRADISFS